MCQQQWMNYYWEEIEANIKLCSEANEVTVEVTVNLYEISWWVTATKDIYIAREKVGFKEKKGRRRTNRLRVL